MEYLGEAPDKPDHLLRLSDAQRLPFIFPLGGQYLLDPGEINGWGNQGPYDDTSTLDLGNTNADPASQINHIAGGLVFPWDIRVTRLFAYHRNNNNAAQAWGWVLLSQEKTPGTNLDPSVFIIDEVGDNGGVGPRDYGNTVTQGTDITLDYTLTSGHTLTLGVSAPTADPTNRYVQIMSGYLLLQRVN